MKRELPLLMLEDPRLQRRFFSGEIGGEPEVRFYWFDTPPILPVWYEGRLRLLQWGNRDRKSRLPYTCCTQRTTVETGGWGGLRPELVRVPGNFGLDQGTWIEIKEGIEGIVVRDCGEEGKPVVYLMCEPASPYYRTMTRSNWVPALINQQY